MTPTDPMILAAATAVDAAMESVQAFLDPDKMPDDTTAEEINIAMMVSQTLALTAIGRALVTIATLMPARKCGDVTANTDNEMRYAHGYGASDFPCVRQFGHTDVHRDYQNDTWSNTAKSDTA